MPTPLVKLEEDGRATGGAPLDPVRSAPVGAAASGTAAAAGGGIQPVQVHSSGVAAAAHAHAAADYDDDEEDEDLIDEDELDEDDDDYGGYGEQDSSLTSCSDRAMAYALSSPTSVAARGEEEAMPQADEEDDEDLVDEDEDDEMMPVAAAAPAAVAAPAAPRGGGGTAPAIHPAPNASAATTRSGTSSSAPRTATTSTSTAPTAPTPPASFLTVRTPPPGDVTPYARQVRSLQELYHCTDLPTMEESYRCVNTLDCRSGVHAAPVGGAGGGGGGGAVVPPPNPDEVAVRLTSQADIAVPYLLRKTMKLTLIGCGLSENLAVPIVRELTEPTTAPMRGRQQQGQQTAERPVAVVGSCVDGTSVTELNLRAALERVRANAAGGQQQQPMQQQAAQPILDGAQVRMVVEAFNKWGRENADKVRTVRQTIMGVGS